MIYFISGPLDLTEEEFNIHYKPIIDAADGSFIIGDAKGADYQAQRYLLCKNVDVTVYHMFDQPRNNFNYKTIGGFKSDEERDAQMTKDSTHDILYIRSPEEMKKRLGKKYKPSYINGTMKNKLRR